MCAPRVAWNFTVQALFKVNCTYQNDQDTQHYVPLQRLCKLKIMYNSIILTFCCNSHFTLTPKHYNPCRFLDNSRRRLQPSLSLALVLQFLTPNFSASLITPSIHLRFGLPARLLPSGLSKVIFLHGRLSYICTICPVHLNLVILTVVTRSVSSYRQYSSSFYLDLHVASSQMGP